MAKKHRWCKINSNAVGSLVQQLFRVYFQYYYSGLPVIERANLYIIKYPTHILHRLFSVHLHIYLVSYFNKRSYHKIAQNVLSNGPHGRIWYCTLHLIEIKEIFVAWLVFIIIPLSLWYCLRSDLIQVSVNIVMEYPYGIWYTCKDKTFRLGYFCFFPLS